MLIVGCGCRGRSLSHRLLEEGHAVRGTTRDPAGAEAIEQPGAEAWIGDPSRLATLTRALDSVTVVCWLLASARGGEEEVRALHDERLRAYLRELVDTTVRGFVYEVRGSVDARWLARGCEICEEAAGTWQLPFAPIGADPSDAEGWTQQAHAAVRSLLAPPARGADEPVG